MPLIAGAKSETTPLTDKKELEDKQKHTKTQHKQADRQTQQAGECKAVALALWEKKISAVCQT